ncbi:MAG: type IX secretion system outer membrane channel protein PorV, partial [Bacteroidales bacterium]|nr:type IX secretion system outer membrane channel protein PorV [Bacteroidales bacterium]
MRKRVSVYYIIICLFLPVSTAIGQDDLNAIQTVVPFLTIAPDSRSGGMGDVGVATSPDIYSMHWNPAKFAFIDGEGGIGIAYSPWLRTLVPDINIAYLAGYYRIDDKQVVSTSLLYSSLGDIPFTDDFGNEQLIFRANEFSIDAGYSRKLTDFLSGGIAFRFIYSNLTGGYYSGTTETKPGTSFASDISIFYLKEISISGKDSELTFGSNISNIGSKMSYTDSGEQDFIPMNMRIGTGTAIYLDEFNKIALNIDLNKLLVPTPPILDPITGEIIKGKDPNVAVPIAIFQSFVDAPGGITEELHEITYSFGAEYIYNNQFAIRTGYFHEHASKGNRKYFTAGAGLMMNVFSLDVSYLMPLIHNHPLARTLRFSLSFDFDAFRNVKTSS